MALPQPARHSIFWIGLLLGLWALPALAQPQTPGGDVYFHEGAQSYIDGQFEEARQTVQDGLKEHPDDEQLLALQQKLDQRSQQSQSQSDKDQEKKEGDEKKEQQKNNSGKQNNEQQQKKSPEGEDQQKNTPPQQQPSEQQPPQQQNSSPSEQGTPEKISQEQALRILQALENKEQKLLREVRRPKGAPRQVEKDW